MLIMSRPMRIEYEDAYYHVMNRGRARQKIFHDSRYFELFLTCLAEAHQRFGVQILSYCLMSNHYHLLIKTPEANLGRAMRHINGVYTQRHNRLKKVDGSLFRGRYKAICVEEDSYQLQLSRYIHLNPLEAKMVKKIDDYPWSSFRYFVTQLNPPAWLYRQEIYEQLQAKSRLREKYRAFVALGVDEELAQFYNKGNTAPYMGSEAFRDWAYAQCEMDETDVSNEVIQLFRPSIEEIVERVAETFKVNKASILVSQRGRVPNNIPRWAAMHLSQELGGKKLSVIAKTFGLKRTGSIPVTLAKLQMLINDDVGLQRKLNKIKRQYET